MTAPVSLPPSCVLYVDGVRYNDGQIGENPADPVALDDLQVVWGRNNALDQPGPSTLTFKVMDMAGGQKFLDKLHIGAKVDVNAEATIYPDPTVSTIPALIPGPSAWLTISGSPTVQTLQSPAGSGQNGGWVYYPPAAYSSNPSAWDAIPRTLAGQSWRLKATLSFPAPFAGWSGWAAEIGPVAFTNPDGTGPTELPAKTVLTPAAPVMDLTFVPPPGVWLGLIVRFYPTGPRWVDLNPATWSSLGATPTWDQLATVTLSAVQMLAPAAGALRSGTVVSGRITDLTAEYDEGLGGTLVSVIAQSHLAELGNRYVGDTPWTVETLQSRFSRIVAASGQAINWTIDTGVQAVPVSWRDVDHQPASTLLGELAKSVSGALWSAASIVTGPFLRLEDIDARPPLYRLTPAGGVVTNLFTRPSFEDNSTANFTATNATLSTPAVTGPVPEAGGRVLQAAVTAAGAMTVVHGGTLYVPVTVGLQYRISVYARIASGSTTAQARVDATYRDTGSAQIGAVVSGTAKTLTTAWQRIDVNLAAAPSNAANLAFVLNVPANAAAGLLVQFDAIMVHSLNQATDPATPYFDGDTADTATIFYGWNGTPKASSSARGGVLQIGISTTLGGKAIQLSACDVLLDPVQWTQTTEDNSTRVVMTWQLQGTDDKGNPKVTGTDQTAVNPVLEAATGQRRIQVTTQLSQQADAVKYGNSLLSRVATPGWRISGLTIQLSLTERLDAATLSLVMQILDGATRVGLGIVLTELPEWSPVGSGTDVGLFLEGGRFTNTDGEWTLELVTSSAKSQGQAAIPWNQMPYPWQWNQFDPGIAWSDLTGVGL